MTDPFFNDRLALPSNLSSRSEIVFIDPDVPDAQALAAGALHGIEVVMLRPKGAAPEQIARHLVRRATQGASACDVVHIVAHGTPGAIAFAAGAVSAETLADSADALAQIRGALGDDARINLWSCETGQGAAGACFLQALSQATGAEIAASTRPVGAADLGGAWDLDKACGAPTTRGGCPFTAAATAHYHATLAASSTVPTGQLSYAVGSAVDTVNVTQSSSSASNSIVLNQPPENIGLDTANNLVFAVSKAASNGYFTLAAYNATTGALLNSVNIANNGNGDLVGGLQVDPKNHVVYVDIDGGAGASATEIEAIGYTPAGVLSTPAYNPSTGTTTGNVLVSAVSDPHFAGATQIALDQQTGSLFYTSNDPSYDTVPQENGVFRINSTGSSQVATQLTRPSQFGTAGSSDGQQSPTGLQIQSLAIDHADDKVYFTAYDPSSNTQQVYWVTADGAANQPAILLTSLSFPGTPTPGGYAIPNTLTFDPNGRALYLSNGGQYIYQLALTTGGAGITNAGTARTPYLSSQNSLGALAFDALPVLSVTGTSASAAQGIGLTLAASAPTITDVDSGGYLQSASVQIANAQSGDLLGIGGTFSYSTTATSVTAGGGTFDVFGTGNALVIVNPTGTENTIAEYQTLLSEVSFKDGNSSTAARTFTWQVNDGAVVANNGVVVALPSGTNATTTTVTIQPPAVAPTITGGAATTSTVSETPVTPFAGVTINDPNSNATDTVTISFNGAGTLNGATSSSPYTFTASPATVSNMLHGLVFKPGFPGADNSSTTTLNVTDTSVSPAGTVTSSMTYTVLDHAAPAVPAAPTLVDDSGRSSTDDITNDPRIAYPTIAGGDYLLYSTNGTTFSTTAPTFATDGTQDGSHTVTIEAENAANAISAPSSLTFTLDTIAPALPSTPTIAGVPDNGYTSNATPTITGTAEANATVTLYRDDAVALGSEIVGTNGQYSFTLTTPLSAGRHIIYATATDAAGNRLHNTSSVSYVNIGTPPALPTTPTIADGTPINGVTGNNEPTIVGTADAGDSVSVFRDNGVLIGTTTAGQTGSYSITETTPLADGRHILYALATDGAGDRSAPGVTYLTVQTAPQSLPSVPTLDDGTPSGGTTSNAMPTISGTADPGDSVSVLRDNGVLIGTTTAGQTGSYSIAETTPLANGSHILYALATDGSGNRSAPGVTYLTVNAVAASVNSMVQAMATMTPQSSAALTASAPSSTPETHLAAPAA